MATIWPWKKNHDHDDGEQGENSQLTGQQRENRNQQREDDYRTPDEQQPDERTRLLETHYLSPDDPEVGLLCERMRCL